MMRISKERLREIAAIPDDEIDTTDIPEAKARDFARMQLRKTHARPRNP